MAIADTLRAAAVVLALAPLAERADGHAMMSFPRPRNALDARLAPWNGSVPAFPLPFDHPNWCALPDAASSDPRKISGGGGQACFWVGTSPSMLTRPLHGPGRSKR